MDGQHLFNCSEIQCLSWIYPTDTGAWWPAGPMVGYPVLFVTRHLNLGSKWMGIVSPGPLGLFEKPADQEWECRPLFPRSALMPPVPTLLFVYPWRAASVSTFSFSLWISDINYKNLRPPLLSWVVGFYRVHSPWQVYSRIILTIELIN